MNNEKRRILIIENSTDDIHLLLENLQTDYAITAATSGEKGLELAKRYPQPDIILLDIKMPGMDGYETCRQLKANASTSDIDVIFISSHDTIEEKLNSYEVGGSDYLTNPVHPEELQQKIKLAINNRSIHQETQKARDEAMQAAMTAMSSAGEQGVILDFMRRSFNVNTVDELAELIVEVTSSFGLENSVQIRSTQKIVHASTTSPILPLEEEILTRMKDAGRLKEKGRHFVVNYGPITQLIKNFPDNEDVRGRLRDHLALLIEGSEARLRSVEISEGLQIAVQSTKMALTEIQTLQTRHENRSVKIMEDVVRELEHSFLTLGLTDEQEQRLLDLVHNGTDQSINNLELGHKIDQKMSLIIQQLEKLVIK